MIPYHTQKNNVKYTEGLTGGELKQVHKENKNIHNDVQAKTISSSVQQDMELAASLRDSTSGPVMSSGKSASTDKLSHLLFGALCSGYT